MEHPTEIQEEIDVQILYRPLAGTVLPGVPTMDPHSEEYIFWKEQIRRCLKGWVAPDGRYINGIQYFGNNLVRMDYFDEETGRACKGEPLLYRDNDNEITDIAWANLPKKWLNGEFSNANDHIEIKARRKGFTFWDIVIELYIFLFYSDYPVGSAYPASKEKNIAEERELFRSAWLRLPPLFHRWRGMELKIISDNLNTPMAIFEVGYEQGKGKKGVSHNYWHQASISSEPKKAGVFKGQTYRRLSAVEAGEWEPETLKSFIALNQDSLSFGSFKIGSFNIGGTSTNITSDWTDYQEIYYDADTYPYSRHMTPAYMVAQGFFNRKTGKSDKAGALAHYMKRREIASKNQDKLRREMAENPIKEDDFFMSSSNTTYDVASINQQIEFCKFTMSQKLWVRGKIVAEYDLSGNEIGLDFVEHPDGEWVVNREYGMPNFEYENLYIGAIDDKFKSQDRKTFDKNKSSRSCMLIYIRPHNFNFPSDRPCAYFLSPSFDLDETFVEFEKGMRFWGIEKTSYELSSEGFVKFLRDQKKLHYLLYYEDLPGFNLTGKGKARHEVTMLGNKHFKEGRYKNIDNIEILESYKKWNDKKNTDIGSCLHLIFKHLKETEYTTVRKKNQTGQDGKPLGPTTRFIVLGEREQNSSRRVTLGRPMPAHVQRR